MKKTDKYSALARTLKSIKQEDAAKELGLKQQGISYIQQKMFANNYFAYLLLLRKNNVDLNKFFDDYIAYLNHNEDMNITTEVFHNDTVHEYLLLADFYEHFLHNLPEVFLIHGKEHAEKMILDFYTEQYTAYVKPNLGKLDEGTLAINFKEVLTASFSNTYYHLVRERLEELIPERFNEIVKLSPIQQHNKYAEIAAWVYNTLTPNDKKRELYFQAFSQKDYSDDEESSINSAIFTYFLNH